MKRLPAQADTGIYLLLTAAVFAVSMGYGSLLPVLAPFIEHLADNGGRYDVSWHAGMLTGVYTLALFAFAPLCGRLSDRRGERPVLLTGLAGYVVTLLLFGLSLTLWQTYAMRIASGIFASAVLPVAMAFVGASHPAALTYGTSRWPRLSLWRRPWGRRPGSPCSFACRPSQRAKGQPRRTPRGCHRHCFSWCC